MRCSYWNHSLGAAQIQCLEEGFFLVTKARTTLNWNHILKRCSGGENTGNLSSNLRHGLLLSVRKESRGSMLCTLKELMCRSQGDQDFKSASAS